MIIGDSAFPKEGALTIDFFGFLISSLSSNSSIMISASNSRGSFERLFANYNHFYCFVTSALYH